MSEAVNIEHMSLVDVLENEKCKPSVHEHLFQLWATSSSHSRSLAPPPSDVSRLLRGQAASGCDVGDIFDQVSRGRTALSIRGTSQTVH